MIIIVSAKMTILRKRTDAGMSVSMIKGMNNIIAAIEAAKNGYTNIVVGGSAGTSILLEATYTLLPLQTVLVVLLPGPAQPVVGPRPRCAAHFATGQGRHPPRSVSFATGLSPLAAGPQSPACGAIGGPPCIFAPRHRRAV